MSSSNWVRVVYGSAVGPGPQRYRVLSTPHRGVVLLLNYRTFAGDPNLTRHGSEVDVDNLSDVFQAVRIKLQMKLYNFIGNHPFIIIYEFNIS